MVEFFKLFKKLFEGKYLYYLFIPLIFALIFGFLAFVYPGIPQGIDLTGGKLMILHVDKQINANELEDFLSKEFALEDLSVTSTMAANGYGLVIQFAFEKNIFNAENALIKAKTAKDESEARKQAETALSFASIYFKYNENEKPANIKELIDFTSDVVDNAKESFSNQIQEKIKQKYNLSSTTAFQIRELSPTIGPVFWNNALFVGLLSAILLTIIIFIFFKEIIPSIAIILAAAFDVLAALGFMAVFRVPLSLASIPALLMLVGYSIDTDIILTTKVLQRKNETPAYRAAEAMRTGLTVTTTALAAAIIMAILAYFNQMFVIFDIAAVVAFGSIGDIIATWLMNAPILLWYAEHKKAKVKR